MKNLSNCKPTEFVRQTSLIKKSIERWLKATNFIEIRKRLPELTVVPQDATDAERRQIVEHNKRITNEQMIKNLSDILDIALDEYPNETLEVIALCCFIDPEHIDDYKTADLLTAISELMNDEAVIGFFTSSARLGLMSI